MDTGENWKRPDRTCVRGCERSATIGYDTCVWCRVKALMARHLPGDVVPELTEAQAILVERSLDTARHALASARSVCAVARGADTHERRDPSGDHVVVLGPAPVGADAPDARRFDGFSVAPVGAGKAA